MADRMAVDLMWLSHACLDMHKIVGELLDNHAKLTAIRHEP
jgi:hypothetical protein